MPPAFCPSTSSRRPSRSDTRQSIERRKRRTTMPTKASTTAKKADATQGSSGKKANPALMKPLQPSKELSAVVGSEPLPRAEVVSKVWDYIKTHKLQDPQNKREIMADEKLQAVFGKTRVTMFEMNKHLAQHLK